MRLTGIIALALAAPAAHALTVDFEGIATPGGFVDNSSDFLDTDGFRFTASGQSFLLSDGFFNIGTERVDNDSDYLTFATNTNITPHTLTVTTLSGVPFSIAQMDAVESTFGLGGDSVIEATGIYAAGGSVATTFTTAPHPPGTLGDFQTFSFDSSFTGLASLVLTMQVKGTVDELAVDNLVLSQVPLPGAALLFMPALVLLQGLGSRARARRS
ncbi:MAG: hypothetical protein HKO62_06535 [Gammaproteobacteria bacterium]|nr:hypothetical protein [Gammaproteobacteria bacterium]NNM00389.1 hypothetical protein [Gammaproteobacteria bacterium]